MPRLAAIRPVLSANVLADSLASGLIGNALSSITGFAATIANALNVTTAVSNWTSGALMGLASLVSPLSSAVIAGHAYAVVNYDSAIKKFTLFNPWGIAYGLLTLSWTGIQNNFSYYDRATGSEIGKRANHASLSYFFESFSDTPANRKKAKRPVLLTNRLHRNERKADPSLQAGTGYQVIENMKIQNFYDEPLSYENAVSLYQHTKEEALSVTDHSPAPPKQASLVS